MTAPKIDPRPCNHPDFSGHLHVTRLEDTKRFTVDVTVKCAACGVPFRFLGLPAGLDLNGAAVSASGEEARLTIAPRGEVLSFLDGAPVGFTARRTKESTP